MHLWGIDFSAPKIINAENQKEKIRKAKWLVNFLESNITIEELENNELQIREIVSWLTRHFPGYLNTVAEVYEYDEWAVRMGYRNNLVAVCSVCNRDPNRQKDLTDNIDKIHRQKEAKIILAIQEQLKSVWNEIKKRIKQSRKKTTRRVKSTPPLGVDHFIPTYDNLSKPSLINVSRRKVFGKHINEVGFSLKHNRINFLRDDMELLRDFMLLIEDLNIDIFCECKDEDCDRWFIRNYCGPKRKKLYCQPKCTARSNSRELRKNPKNAERYKKSKEIKVKKYKEKVLGRK